MERLANRLYQWCDRGRYAQLFDRPTNVAVQGPVTYIDLGQIAAHPDLMPVVVLILSDLIYREATRAPGRERTLVIQDELWSVLADPAAAKLLDDMYRRFRHVGAGILSISQDFQDFQSPEARAILRNATWGFFLQLSNVAETAELAGLNGRQARLLGRLRSRAGEYSEILTIAKLGDRTESGVLVARPTSLEFWLSASYPGERALRQRMIDEDGAVIAGLERLAREQPRGADAWERSENR